jgi:hypothetical protein
VPEVERLPRAKNVIFKEWPQHLTDPSDGLSWAIRVDMQAA